MSRKRKFIIAGLVVVVLIVGVSLYIGLGHAGGGHLTVTELKEEGTSYLRRSIRVGGKVAFGSVNWDPKNRVMRFALTDGQETLNVIYRGVVPDIFEPGAELVVEGEYGATGVFEARSFSSKGSPFYALCH